MVGCPGLSADDASVQAHFEFKYDDCGTLLQLASEGQGVNLA